jgi:hypothetical protein
MLHEQRRIGFGGGPVETLNQATPLAREMEDPVFLDEPLGVASPIRLTETSSAFEIFPDEDYGKDPAVRGHSDRGPTRLFKVRKIATDGRVVDEVATIGKIRPGMLLLFFVAAALAAFGTVRACQVSSVSSVTIWQPLGR